MINLYFYSKLVALVSYLSTLKSQINILSIIFSWYLSQLAFVFACWRGLCTFSLCIFYFPTPFLWFLESLLLIMYIWCLLFSQFCDVFFFHVPANILAVCWLFLHSTMLSTTRYIFEARQLGCSGSQLEFIFSFLFFVYFLKSRYHEEPETLSLNSYFFCRRELCIAGEYKPSFFPGFPFFCLPPPPNPIPHPAFSLEVRILQWIFVSFLHSNSSS